MHSLINEALDYNIASGKVGLDSKSNQIANRNLAAFGGDYWQNGQGYLGPLPKPPDKKSTSQVEAHSMMMLQIARVFCAENVFLEVVERQVSALLARPPLISYERRSPSQQGGNAEPAIPGEDAPQDELVTEAVKAMNEWLSSKRVRLAMARVFARRLLTKYGALRLFVPPRFTVPAGVQGKTLTDILNGLGIDEPSHNDARVIYDPNDASYVSLARFGKTDTNQQGKIEVGFVDDAGQTFIGVLSPSLEGQKPKSVKQLVPIDKEAGQIEGLPKFAGEPSQPLKLHGRLLTYELTGPLLTTEQVWQNACGLALSLTMANHVTIENGFAEMVLTNVDLPVEEIPDSSVEGGIREEPIEIIRGSATVSNFQGVVDETDTGQRTTTPGVHWKEPSPIDTHVEGVDLHYTAILREVRQMHASISGDATASGESRKQALKDFADATTALLLELNDFGTWLIEAALYISANILGRTDLLELRGRFEGQISAGSLSTEEENAILQQVEKKLRSKKSARNLLGIFDSDAEEQQIMREVMTGAEFMLTVPQPEPVQPAQGPGNNPAKPGGPAPVKKPAPA